MKNIREYHNTVMYNIILNHNDTSIYIFFVKHSNLHSDKRTNICKSAVSGLTLTRDLKQNLCESYDFI